MPSRSPARPAADPPVSPKPRAAKAAAAPARKIAKKVAKAAAMPAAAKAKKVAKTASEPAVAKKVARAAPAKSSAVTRPSGQEPKASPGVGVGERAPAFTLPADDGKTYSLAALKGQRVVLYFYPRDNTPGCTTEACDFRDRQDAFTRAGATVLGVSGDSLKAHASFRGKQRLNFPLLSDAGNAVASAYGAFGDKMMYGRSLQGIIRSTFIIGPDGAIEAVWRPVKVNGHAETVLQTVAASAAKK